MENEAQALPQAASPSLGLSPQQATAGGVQLFRAQWHCLGGDTPYNEHTKVLYNFLTDANKVSRPHKIHFIRQFPQRWQCLLGGVFFSFA